MTTVSRWVGVGLLLLGTSAGAQEPSEPAPPDEEEADAPTTSHYDLEVISRVPIEFPHGMKDWDNAEQPCLAVVYLGADGVPIQVSPQGGCPAPGLPLIRESLMRWRWAAIPDAPADEHGIVAQTKIKVVFRNRNPGRVVGGVSLAERRAAHEIVPDGGEICRMTVTLSADGEVRARRTNGDRCLVRAEGHAAPPEASTCPIRFTIFRGGQLGPVRADAACPKPMRRWARQTAGTWAWTASATEHVPYEVTLVVEADSSAPTD